MLFVFVVSIQGLCAGDGNKPNLLQAYEETRNKLEAIVQEMKKAAQQFPDQDFVDAGQSQTQCSQSCLMQPVSSQAVAPAGKSRFDAQW